jgi:SH3-like domain-containing protein
VSATVRGWVRVRSGASHDARTVAMIGPDTRLQVGEVRGSWIRIRSAGATGWVEQQQLQKNSTFRRPRASTGVGVGTGR